MKVEEVHLHLLKEERIKYFHPNRYEIGQYASEHGNASVSRKFSPMFDKKISEITVRGLKSVYQKEMKKMKRKLVETDSADSNDDLGVTELNPSKRGRKTLLGEKLDSKVQFFY